VARSPHCVSGANSRYINDKTEESCQSLLSSPEEALIQSRMKRISTALRAGRLTRQRAARKYEKLITDIIFDDLNLTTKERNRKVGLIKGLIAVNNQKMANNFGHEILLRKLNGDRISKSGYQALATMGLDRPKEQMNELQKIYKRPFELLKQNGLRFSSKQGWNFSNLNLDRLKNDINLQISMLTFFPKDVAVQLLNPNRNQAIQLGHQVILPHFGDRDQRKLKVLSQSEYQKRVQTELSHFNQDLKDFLVTSKKSNNAFRMLGAGIKQNVLNREASERPENPIYTRAMKRRTKLTRLGVSKQVQREMSGIITDVLSQERQYIKRGIKNATRLTYAAIAAPVAIYATVAAAPTIMGAGVTALGIAGTKAGTALVAGAAKATLISASLPLIFGTLSTGITAGLRSRKNGDFLCHFADVYQDVLPVSLIAAPVFALLPSLAPLAATAVGTVSPTGATVAYHGTRIATALGFSRLLIRGGVNEASGAHRSFEAAEKAFDEGDEHLGEALLTQGYEQFAQAGIDTAFLVSVAGNSLRYTSTLKHPDKMTSRKARKILGVKKNANAHELKTAKRRLAKKWHPDKNPNNAKASAKFKQAIDAFELLTNPETLAVTTGPKLLTTTGQTQHPFITSVRGTNGGSQKIEPGQITVITGMTNPPPGLTVATSNILRTQELTSKTYPIIEIQKRWDEEVKVIYFNAEQRESHRIRFKDGDLYNSKGELLSENMPYVVDLYGNFYWVPRSSVVRRINHSSLLAGGDVKAAGWLNIRFGRILKITNQSGHYQPGGESIEVVLDILESEGVKIRGIEIVIMSE